MEQTNMLLWIATVALAMLIQGGSCSISLEVTGATETAKGLYHTQGGANFVLHCHIPLSAGENTSAVLSKLVGEDGVESLITLASATELEEGYTQEDIPRYSLNYTLQAGVQHSTRLYITGADVQDSGTYTCGKDTADLESLAQVTVQVIKDVATVEMSIDGTEVTEDGEEKLDEPATKTIRCEATGSNPAPGIKLMQADTDITYLLKDAKITNDVEQTIIENDALVSMDYTGTLEGQLEVTALLSGDKLSCHASVPESETPAVPSASRTFMFDGDMTASQLPSEDGPKPEDSDTDLKAQLLGDEPDVPKAELYEPAQLPTDDHNATDADSQEASQLPSDEKSNEFDLANLPAKIEKDGNATVPEPAMSRDPTTEVPVQEELIQKSASDPLVMEGEGPKPELLDPSKNVDGAAEGTDVPVFDSEFGDEVTVGYHHGIKVTAKVTADPEITRMYFYWHEFSLIEGEDDDDDDEIEKVENPDTKIILEPMTQSISLYNNTRDTWADNGKYLGFVYQDKEGNTVMELEIQTMYSQMYRKHFMVAENAHGPTEFEFTFVEDPNEPIPESSATSVCWTYLTTLVVPLTFLLLTRLT